MVKKKAKKFSAVKAVKANARDRVGQPKAERVIADKTPPTQRGTKHKKSLSELIRKEE